MDIREYGNLGEYQYTYEAKTVIEKEIRKLREFHSRFIQKWQNE